MSDKAAWFRIGLQFISVVCMWIVVISNCMGR